VGTDRGAFDLKPYCLCRTPAVVSVLKLDDTGKSRMKGRGVSERPGSDDESDNITLFERAAVL